VDVPATRYARSGDLQIAFQVVGAGSLDVVFVPVFSSSIDAVWALPGAGDLLRGVASFSRLLLFDRRGSGMSDGTPGVASLEEQVDDVLAVIGAAGLEHPAVISVAEGCALATVFAASHPSMVRSLVMLTPVPRALRDDDYEWAPSQEERQERIRVILDHWGSESPENPLVRFVGADSERGRQAVARLQRLSMSPGAAAAAQRLVSEIDVRHLLPSIQCPTLILRRGGDTIFDERHSRYAADHIASARYVELSGDGPVWRSDDVDGAVDEIQRFLTGAHHRTVSDRVLATVLFTDIVGSTERAARLGDDAWRSLLRRHDDLVREEIERHRGRKVKSLGDGVLATFDGPSRAISSALAIRDRALDLGLDIRAGLHAGECELLDGDDVGGMAVHIGARISRLAGPGEVLVSSTVRDLIVGSGQAVIDRGERDLKGVPGPWRIYAVDA
jgi:class 3 adenylate cyclase